MVLQAQGDVYQIRFPDQIRDHIINRHVPCANDPGKYNIVMIIEKNTAPEEDEFYEYPYYIARMQISRLTIIGPGTHKNLFFVSGDRTQKLF